MRASAIARTHWVLGSLLAVAAASAAHAHTDVAERFLCGFQASWSACGFSQQAKAPDRITLGVGAERGAWALSPGATACSGGREQGWPPALLFPPDYEVPVATPADPWPWG